MPDFYDSQHSQNDGVVLASSIAGTPVGLQTAAHAGTQAEGSTVQAAAGYSTRPYRKPKRRPHDKGHVLCAEEGCKGYPMKTNPYCSGHARSKGLVDMSFQPIEAEDQIDEHAR